MRKVYLLFVLLFVPFVSATTISNSLANFTTDLYASNLFGSLNASYVLNPPWLTLSSSGLNDTILSLANVSLKVDKSSTITVTSSPLLCNGATSCQIDGGVNLSMSQSSSLVGGFLTANDWNYFSGKLNVSDQRFNFTSMIGAVNSSANILQLFAQVQRDPQGFVDDDNSNANLNSRLSFNDSTRNFSISPVGVNFSYYEKGVLVVKSSSNSLVISDTSGSHIIYFDSSGVLQEASTLTLDILCNNVIVAIVYWDSLKHISYMTSDERHTHFMECSLHQYLHEHLGTQYDSGLSPLNVTVGGSTSLNSSAQIGVGSGAISDEDFTHNILSYPFPANLRVYYQLGASNNWSYKKSVFPFVRSGDSTGFVGAGGRIAYNLNTAGVWSLAEATSTNYVLFHVIATNSFDNSSDLIVVEGQAQYSTLASARTGADTEIANIRSSGVFSPEYKVLYTFTLQTNTGWTNGAKAIIVSPSSGGSFIDWRTSNLNGASGSASGVTSVSAGAGLLGGSITSSGTLSLNSSYTDTLYCSLAGGSSVNGTTSFVNANVSSSLNLGGGFSNGGATFTSNGNAYINNLYLFGSINATTVGMNFMNGSQFPSLNHNWYIGNSTLSFFAMYGDTFYENGVSLASKYVQSQTSAVCTYGIANFSVGLNSTTVVCASQQGTVTSITPGNGFSSSTPITSSGTLTLGTPGSVTASSSNAVTTNSHTHAIDSTIATSSSLNTVNSSLNLKLNLSGGVLTGNVTLTNVTITGVVSYNSTVSFCGVNKNAPCYIMYINATFWDCVNTTGTIYNRGNNTVTCS